MTESEKEREAMEAEMAKLSLSPPPSHKSTPSTQQRLPNEILDHIWHATIKCTGPRIVNVRFESKIYGLTSSCKIPPLLHACSRSRELALLRWKLCFPATSELESEAVAQENERNKPKIFFDYEMDTLFFTQEFIDVRQFVEMVSREERMKIRSLAFDLLAVSAMFHGRKFGRTFISLEFDRNKVVLAFVVREGADVEQVWDRGSKMVRFVQVTDPRRWMDRLAQDAVLFERTVRFLKVYVGIGRDGDLGPPAPWPAFVGLQLVEGGEAWEEGIVWDVMAWLGAKR